MGKGGGGLEGEGRVRKHMLGQRNTLNESTTKSLEGLLVITFFPFCFVSPVFILVICYPSWVICWVYLASREHEGIGGSACYKLEDFAVEMN